MKEVTLIIPGTLPGLNDYVRAERANKFKAAKFKKRIEARIGWSIREQLPGVHFKGPVSINYLWCEPNRRRDKDNVAWAKKMIQDALVSCRVLDGDSWRHIVAFSDHFAVDRDNPRVEVRIKDDLPGQS